MHQEDFIKFIRLNNGDDIICSVTRDDTSERPIICHSPLKIAYTPSMRNPTYMTVALIQWIFPGLTDNTTVSLAERDVLFAENASLKMVDYYYQTLDDFNEVMNKSKKEQLKEMTDEEILDGWGDINPDGEMSLMSEEDQQSLDEILRELNLTKDKGKLH